MPVFPLPNVVLFPGTTQPLYMFEQRYCELARDAVGESGLIAMALLRPGYEAYYYTNLAAIYPIVCVGEVREHVALPDGQYLLNLHGVCRARVLDEDREGPYRTAMLEPLPESAGMIEGDGIISLRTALEGVLSAPPFDDVQEAEELRPMLGSALPLGPAVDALTCKLVPPEEVEIKQRILEELDVLKRGGVLLDELKMLARSMNTRRCLHDGWPRRESAN